MKRDRPRTGVIVLVILLMVLSLIQFTWLLSPTAADPVISDLGTGNKTASWTFSTPGDYTSTDVVFSAGVTLNTTGGNLLQDTTTDFQSNGTWDATNLTVAGGSIATNETRAELVQNGNFTSNAQWIYTSSSDGNVTVGWDSVNESGSLWHNRSYPQTLQVDGMNTGFGTVWSVSLTGSPQPHLLNDAFQDFGNRTEPPASVQLDVRFRSDQTGLCSLSRDFAGLDWSSYNTLSMWFNTSYVGTGTLQSFVHLVAGVIQWNSSRVNITPGWQKYDFNISNFTARNAVTHIDIRFTNLRNENSVKIWTDDIHLSRYDKGSRIGEMHQVLNKASWTDPLPGTLSLLFAYRVDSPSNLVNANLTVFINGAPITVPPLSVLNPLPWTPMNYDVSSLMSDPGLYNLSFALDITFNTPLTSFVQVQVDDVSITVPEHHDGIYESIAFDLGNAYMFDIISWSSSSHPDTSVLVEVRAGYSPILDSTWTMYEPHTTQPEQFLPLPATGRYLQYRVTLTTTNTSASVSFDLVGFSFHRFRSTGSVETFDFTPPEELIMWHNFGASYNAPQGTTVTFYASDNNGTSWSAVLPDTSLSFLIGQQMRIRVNLSASNTTRTPTVTEVNVTYEFRGMPFRMSISPKTWSGTADEQVQFTAKAWDEWWHDVTIVFTWTDDDPAGSVDATGLYSAGTVGSHIVCASSPLYSLIDCANVTVSLGSLASIVVSPPTITIPAGDPQLFTADGYDADGNPFVLNATVWTTDVGLFDYTAPDYAFLRAQGVPGSGFVQAEQGGVWGQSSVTVISSTSIFIRGVVPNQLKPEDSPTWSLDLSGHLPPGPPADTLMWYLEGVNESLYSVFGEKRFGQHSLWFTPKPDAFGVNNAVLWLENKTGARASQNIRIELTPVNDAPVFYDVPLLTVRADTSYVFSYHPYIFDVDDPHSSLFLTTNDPLRARWSGLTVNYTYDSSFNGQTVLVELTVNDGLLSSKTIQRVKVTDETGVQIIAPLPPIMMFEDTPANDVFPNPLDDYFIDPDGGTLNYSMVYSPYFVPSFWPQDVGNHLNLTPKKDWFGVECITIRAYKTEEILAEQKVTVTVQPVNDPPVLDWHDDLYVKFDTVYTLDLEDFVSDIDDPHSSLLLSVNRSDVVTVEMFRLHVMMPGYRFQFNPVVPLSIALTDGKATVFSNITVRASDNEPPIVLNSMPTVTFNEDEQALRVFDAKNYFYDTDGPQPLTFTVQTKVLTASVDTRNDRAFLNFSAPQDWFGMEVVQVRASDGISYAIGRVTVRVLPVNDGPVFDPLPDQDMGHGGTRVIDLRQYVHDIDNNITELFFTAIGTNVKVFGYMLVLDYTSSDNPEDITVIANDSDKEASRTFHVSIQPVDGDGGIDIIAALLLPVSVVVLLVFVYLGALAYSRAQDRRYSVEDLFLVGGDGRLIMHNTRHLRADRDEDAIANTLAAILRFIRTTFYDSGEQLGSFEFNERNVIIQKGMNFYVAGIYPGELPETVASSFGDFAQDIEEEFGTTLDEWSGDVKITRSLRSFMDAFVAHRRYKRGDWKGFARGGK